MIGASKAISCLASGRSLIYAGGVRDLDPDPSPWSATAGAGSRDTTAAGAASGGQCWRSTRDRGVGAGVRGAVLVQNHLYGLDQMGLPARRGRIAMGWPLTAVAALASAAWPHPDGPSGTPNTTPTRPAPRLSPNTVQLTTVMSGACWGCGQCRCAARLAGVPFGRFAFDDPWCGSAASVGLSRSRTRPDECPASAGPLRARVVRGKSALLGDGLAHDAQCGNETDAVRVMTGVVGDLAHQGTNGVVAAQVSPDLLKDQVEVWTATPLLGRADGF